MPKGKENIQSVPPKGKESIHSVPPKSLESQQSLYLEEILTQKPQENWEEFNSQIKA